MGKITNENRRALENTDKYEDAILSGMTKPEFTAELDLLIQQKGISTQTIVERTHLSKSYINKLRSPSEKALHPSRYVIIDIALAINASLEEINHLLKLAQYQELYTRNKAESLIIWGLLKKLSGEEIHNQLFEQGLDDIFKERILKEK